MINIHSDYPQIPTLADIPITKTPSRSHYGHVPNQSQARRIPWPSNRHFLAKCGPAYYQHSIKARHPGIKFDLKVTHKTWLGY